MPAVDLTQGLQAIPSADSQHCGIEGLDRLKASVTQRFEDFLGHVAIMAGVIGRPDPAGPCTVGRTDSDFVARTQANRIAVFFLVVGVCGESGHHSGPKGIMINPKRHP